MTRPHPWLASAVAVVLGCSATPSTGGPDVVLHTDAAVGEASTDLAEPAGGGGGADSMDAADGAGRAMNDEVGAAGPVETEPWAVMWSTPLGGRPISALATDDERIVLVTGKPDPWKLLDVAAPYTLRAFDHSGKPLWSAPADGNYHAPPILDEDGSVILSQSNLTFIGPFKGSSSVSRYSPDGELVWSVPLAGVMLSKASALSPDGVVFVAYEGGLVALDRDGSEVWSYALPVLEAYDDHGEFAPLVSKGAVYITQINGVARKFDLAGNLVWQEAFPSGYWCGTIALLDGTLVGAPGFAFDETAKVLWTDVQMGGGCPTSRGQRLFFGSGTVSANSGGKRDWYLILPNSSGLHHAPTVTADGNLVGVLDVGYLTAVMTQDGKLLNTYPHTFKPSKYRWSLIREGLLVTSTDDSLLGLNATEEPDRSAWYAVHGGSRNTRSYP